MTAALPIDDTATAHSRADLTRAVAAAHTGAVHLIRIDAPAEAGVLRLTDTGGAQLEIAGSSHVHVGGNVIADVHEQAAVFASGCTDLRADGASRVIAIEHARVHADGQSYVEAHDNTSVDLHGHARGYLRGHAAAVAHDRTCLEAYDDAVVEGHDAARLTVHDRTLVAALPPAGQLVVYGNGVRTFDAHGELVTLPGLLEPGPSLDDPYLRYDGPCPA